MKWIKGGKWQVVPVEGPSAVEYTAFLLPRVESPDVHSIQRRWAARNAARSFLDDPDKWDREIGRPASLKVYAATRRTAMDLLRDMEKMCTEFEGEFGATPLEECAPLRREAIIRRLVQMLVTYGPLRGVDEVIDVSSIGVAMPEVLTPRSVDLDVLTLEVAYFAEIYGLIKDEGVERRRLASRMQVDSAVEIRDVRVVVELGTRGEIGFAARPITLRAFLWEVLFDLHDRRPGNCLVCHRDFHLLPVRGRPFAYCPDHRGSKYRTAEHEKKLAKKGR